MVASCVLLDAGPLGLLSNPKLSPASISCAQWLQGLLRAGVRVVIPEIADYEVRRELLRAGKTKGLHHLDALGEALDYLPLSTAAFRQAALFWALARQQGQATAGDNTIDADMILVAQAHLLRHSAPVIATTNVGHLSRFTTAELWPNIQAAS